MHIFYCPDVFEHTYTLNNEESGHCVRVLRLSVGDFIVIVDGKGLWKKAKIIDAHPKNCKVEITEVIENQNKRAQKLHIGIAPTKNIERMEWFLEKAAEIGIDEITPLHCKNSERTILKLERLNKVLIAAMKQSQSAYLPKLNDLTNFESFIESQNYIQRFIAHCADSTNKKALKDVCKKNENTLILIGPEGDFTTTEIKQALQNNYEEISLSNSRLRTETAAIMACSTFDLVNS